MKRTVIVMSTLVLLGCLTESEARANTELGWGITLTTIGGLGTLAGLGAGITALTLLPDTNRAETVASSALWALGTSAPILAFGIKYLVQATGMMTVIDATAYSWLELATCEPLSLSYTWIF